MIFLFTHLLRHYLFLLIKFEPRKKLLMQDSVTNQKHLGMHVANELNLLKKSSNRSGRQHTCLTDSTDRSRRDSMRILQTFAREGPCQGDHASVCPSVGGPSRVPSIAIEKKEEQKLELKK
jgi:hypothetical protein